MAFGSELGLIRFNCFKELYKNSFYPSNLISNAAYLTTPSQLGYSSSSAPSVSPLMPVLFRSLPFILFCRNCFSRNPEEQADSQKIIFLFSLATTRGWSWTLSLPVLASQVRDCRYVLPLSHDLKKIILIVNININVIKETLGQALMINIISSSILGENYFYYPWFMIN